MADAPDPTDPDYKVRLKRKVQRIFQAYIIPLNILTVFHAYNENVLTERDIERVKAVTESKGNQDAALELLDRLVQYDGWFPCLMDVLRDRNVKLYHVANKMEEVKGVLDGIIEEENQSEIKRLQESLEEKDQQMLEQRTFIETLKQEKIELQEQLGRHEIRLGELSDELKEAKEHYASEIRQLTDEKKKLTNEIENLKRSHAAELKLSKESGILRASEASELKSLKNDQDQEDQTDSSTQAEIKRLRQQLEEQDLLTAKLISGKDQLIQAVLFTSEQQTQKILVAHLIKLGHHQGLESLMECGIDINIEVEEGITALIFAALQGQTECLQYLISTGADVNKKDGLGQTALLFAAANGYADCIQALLNAGGNKEVTEKKRGWTPLIAAVKHHKCVQVLMEAGCDINRTDTLGKTALFYAAGAGNHESVQAFLDAGADPNRQDNRHCTPVIYASQSGNAQCLQALLNARASPHVQSPAGKTPLIYAAGRGDSECVHLLLESSASPNAHDKQWDTPLIHAARGGHILCAELLLFAGAELGHRNVTGFTALDVAKGAECKKVIETYFYLQRPK